MATNGQAQELKKELSEQAQAQEQRAQALQEEIEIQGKTLSAFTIVNVLFLPLAFFTQASTAFTGMLILLLTEISLRSISARATIAQEMALLAVLSDYFGLLQLHARSSFLWRRHSSSCKANTNSDGSDDCSLIFSDSRAGNGQSKGRTRSPRGATSGGSGGIGYRLFLSNSEQDPRGLGRCTTCRHRR